MIVRFVRLVVALFVAQVLLFFAFLFVMAGIAAFWADDTPDVAANTGLWIDLSGEIPEYSTLPRVPILEDELLTQHAILEGLTRAATDSRVDGVLLEIGASDLGWGKAAELRSAVRRLRDAGKQVWAYGNVLDERGLYVAAACDSIYLPPRGRLLLDGIAVEGLYFRGLFDKYGLRPSAHRIGAYKDAIEPWTRSGMSDASRRQTEWLLDEVWGEFQHAVAADRRLEPAQMEAALAAGVVGAEDARARGLVDGIATRQELAARFGDDGGEPRLLAIERYAHAPRAAVHRAGGKRIAVVHTRGVILEGRNSYNPAVGAVLGAASVARDLRIASQDDGIAAIVLRIDSPGGDVIASDVIASAVERARDAKPIVVSMVDVAASGGYMMAYRASRIVALPNTITGSIGIFSGKLNVAGLAARFGIAHDAVARGAYPFLYSGFRDWSAAEESLVAREHWTDYRSWIADVAARRTLTAAAVDSIGRGRVWTGQQAVARRLVDEIGDLHRAVQVAARLAELDTTAAQALEHFPKPVGFLQALREDRLSLFAAGFGRWVGRVRLPQVASWSLLQL